MASSRLVVTCPTPPGVRPVNIQEMILANALNVYNAGARIGLKRAGYLIGKNYSTKIKVGYGQEPPIGGRPYVHKTKGKTTASHPGSAPAKQSGKLKRSVGFISSQLPVRGLGSLGKLGRLMKGFGATAIEIFSKLDYARDLEFGYIGDNGRPVAARPLWRVVRHNFDMRKYMGKQTKNKFLKAEREAAKKLATSTPTRLVIAAESFRSPHHGPA